MPAPFEQQSLTSTAINKYVSSPVYILQESWILTAQKALGKKVLEDTNAFLSPCYTRMAGYA